MKSSIFASVIVGLCAVNGLNNERRDEVNEEGEAALALEAPQSPRYLQRRLTTVFYDDFSSGQIDPNKWRKETSAAGFGYEMWTPEAENSYVRNGILFIRPTLTVDRFGNDFLAHGTVDAKTLWGSCNNWDCHQSGWNHVRPIMSALLRSSGHIKYGKVEVVAKLPKGDWIWPAIWMMPLHNTYGGWPRSGEIDIMEAAGNENLYHPNGQSWGVDVDHATIHYGPVRDPHQRHGDRYRIDGTTFGNNFHRYWLDWTENYIKIGVDDHLVLAVDTPPNGFWQEGGFTGDNIWSSGGRNAPFDQPFYVILDVAVGGPFFWNGLRNEPYAMPWDSSSDTQMMQFWNARHNWYPTWHGEDAALKVRSVKMEQY